MPLAILAGVLLDRMAGVAVRSGAHRVAELANPVTERAREFGQPFGAEDDERDGADEQQVNGILDAHLLQASARDARAE
jgi:hypothetical protein